MSRTLLVLIMALSVGCAPGSQDSRSAAQDPAVGDIVVSFLGKPLRPTPLPEEARVDYEAALATARAEFAAHPESVDAIIWLGRRQAYLGRYQEAIETYSRGIERLPSEPRLYRHRGHRYITIRQLDKAVADLETAADLIRGTEDQVEPDGLPNARGIPTSTLQSNIWYHLGLTHYLQGDFQGALGAYQECLEVSGNPDMLVATTYWLYMTLRRLGLDEEAHEALGPITADLDVIENHEYHVLLLMYRNEIPVQDIWPGSVEGLASATLGYGVGNWHLYNARQSEAEATFLWILEGDRWAAFGYLAAEVEIARLQGLVPR